MFPPDAEEPATDETIPGLDGVNPPLIEDTDCCWLTDCSMIELATLQLPPREPCGLGPPDLTLFLSSKRTKLI